MLHISIAFLDFSSHPDLIFIVSGMEMDDLTLDISSVVSFGSFKSAEPEPFEVIFLNRASHVYIDKIIS